LIHFDPHWEIAPRDLPANWRQHAAARTSEEASRQRVAVWRSLT
jgi:hypothetical protein